ncbi:DUF1524 domain-containing protein [Shewanella baltica]
MFSLSISNGLAAADLKYHREDYPHWTDLDGNGLNTRQDLLATQSTVKPSFSRDGKTVMRGRWVSPWTGQIYLDAFMLDVDHTVPLGYAHARGAKYWNSYQREVFANDVRNLQIVEKGLNIEKGAAGINEWLPPFNQCHYILRFHRIMKIYQLKYFSNEESRVQELVAQCKNRQ